MLKYINNRWGYTRLYKSHKLTGAGIDLSFGALVDSIGTSAINEKADAVVYENNLGERIDGYILSSTLDPYYENYPKDLVDMGGLQTPDRLDAFQYSLIGGIKQTNLCGEICCARLAGVSLPEIMEVWKQKDLPLYKRILGGGKFSGTGAEDLIKILSLFGIKAQSIESMKQYTAYALQQVSGRMIVSCHIDTTGRLKGEGILHWILVENVVMERIQHHTVIIFNPFNGRQEPYSWNEFIQSCGQTYGIMLV